MFKPKNLKGAKFGRLVVLAYAGHGNSKCYCTCGKIKIIRTDSLASGNSRSCGCLSMELRKQKKTFYSHMIHTPTYKSWSGMIQRCNNKNNRAFKNYGGRGIKVCKRWLKFENFWKDMGTCPEGLSLDRKNNDGNYCKSNCRWVTRDVQANNQRANRIVFIGKKRFTLTQACKYLHLSKGSVERKLYRRHWSLEKSLGLEN